MAKAENLTARVLTSILLWADHCRKAENYQWTKWDELRYGLVEDQIKKHNSDIYEKRKSNIPKSF